MAPLYFPSVKPFRWCPIHQKVIMKLRSSSVTRFKEEIGNEKTNITDGNLFTFSDLSITPELCNCKQIYALIVSILFRICEIWRVNRLRGILLLDQNVV